MIRCGRYICLFILLCGIFFCNGCGLVDELMGYTAPEELARKAANGEADMDDVMNGSIPGKIPENVVTMVGENGEILYLDEVSGQYYTEAYYNATKVCDFLKSILFEVILYSWLFGLILFVVFKKSAKMRKISIAIFDVSIPALYVTVLYIVCYMVDHTMM